MNFCDNRKTHVADDVTRRMLAVVENQRLEREKTQLQPSSPTYQAASMRAQRAWAKRKFGRIW